MKTIKVLFAVLCLSTMFVACEAETINEEVGIEDVDLMGEEEIDELEDYHTGDS